MQPTPAKPGILLIVSAVLVMAECVAWTSMALGAALAMVGFWIFFVWLIVPFAALLGISQYLSLVRRNATAADTTAILLALLVCLWSMYFLSATSGAVSGMFNPAERRELPWTIGVAAVSLLRCGQFGIAAYANWRWARRLSAESRSGLSPQSIPFWRFTVRELLLATTAFAVAAATCAAILRWQSLP